MTMKILVAELFCWWSIPSAGDFSGWSVTINSNGSTYQTCQQQKLSPTSVTNIDVTKLEHQPKLTSKSWFTFFFIFQKYRHFKIFYFNSIKLLILIFDWSQTFQPEKVKSAAPSSVMTHQLENFFIFFHVRYLVQTYQVQITKCNKWLTLRCK